MGKQYKMACDWYDKNFEDVRKCEKDFHGINHDGLVCSGDSEDEVRAKMSEIPQNLGEVFVIKRGEKETVKQWCRFGQGVFHGQGSEIHVDSEILRNGNVARRVSGLLDTGSHGSHLRLSAVRAAGKRRANRKEKVSCFAGDSHQVSKYLGVQVHVPGTNTVASLNVFKNEQNILGMDLIGRFVHVINSRRGEYLILDP